jgi:hypothetical protein
MRYNNQIQIPFFSTEEEAFEWMEQEVDDPCTDNYRFAYTDDDESVYKFYLQEEQGCCGSFSMIVCVNGRDALIGCNYGH